MTKRFTSFILMVGVLALNFGFIVPREADAASLTSISDTVTNLTAGAVANHTIQFTTPTGVASGQTIILTFDNSTSIASGLTFADIDLKDDGSDLPLAASPSGATWGVVRTSGTVITFTNGTTAVAAGSVLNIEIGTNATFGVSGTQQVTNGSAGSTVLRMSGSFGDTGALTIPIVANGVVAVSAEVLSTLSFTVSDNTIYFGNLRSAGACFAQGTDPGYVTCPTTTETEAFNMTASTNAPTGYTVSVQGATLTSGLNTITALASNTASSPGTEQFGLRANATGGSGTVSAPYAASGYAYTGTASTPATVATATTPSDTTTYSVRYLANISPVTEAGSYTTSHTYVATGNF
jgi:hypothetical protein